MRYLKIALKTACVVWLIIGAFWLHEAIGFTVLIGAIAAFGVWFKENVIDF